jgi:hypothetical protein
MIGTVPYPHGCDFGDFRYISAEVARYRSHFETRQMCIVAGEAV